MAELGDFITQGPKAKQEVTVEMMDYAFVDECQDAALLRGILAKLKSGDEGFYPHLNAHVEKKLMSLLPEKERKKIARLKSGPDPAEEAEAEADLMSWTAQIKKEDETLTASAARDTSLTERVLPPVRGANGVVAPKRRKPKPKKKPEPELPKKTPASHVHTAKDYFNNWDKYDVDAEEKRIEEVDKENDAQAKRAWEEIEAKEKAKKERRAAELSDMREEMQVDTMSQGECDQATQTVAASARRRGLGCALAAALRRRYSVLYQLHCTDADATSPQTNPRSHAQPYGDEREGQGQRVLQGGRARGGHGLLLARVGVPGRSSRGDAQVLGQPCHGGAQARAA
mmetsp:Transcript_72932/g.207816  ORF Transcript_72932/g.207816 Transcript_72932/m.207816 type:complete len:342 (+) Transcript_72932:188-1213(+)